MENIKLTDDIISSIQNLVKLFGGIDNTVSITGVSKSSLKKYLNKKTDIISKNVWNEKLFPYMQPNLYDKISDRIHVLEEERDEYHDAFSTVLKEKYSKISEIEKYNEKYSIDKKIIKNIFRNPFLSFTDCYVYGDSFKDLNDFKKAITELKNNKNYSKYELVYYLTNFKNIYEKFRPITITNDDIYWGTVKVMDEICVFLFSYIDMDIIFTFTKWPNSYIKSKIPSHEDINWDSIIEDIDKIINSVISKMSENAMELISILRENAPLYCQFVIEQAIQIFSNEINIEKINFDFDKNELVINETHIELNEHIRIKYELWKMKENGN